jgi:hypothetical protein
VVEVGAMHVPLPGAGQPAALAAGDDETFYVQTVAPFGLWSIRDGLAAQLYGDEAPPPEGDPLLRFHRDAGVGIACASCHPEGQDDGHVWRFGEHVSGVATPGPRKTLPLAGTITARAPYHWAGELPTPADLAASTFTAAMGGDELPPDEVDALFAWLDGLRPVRATSAADAATLERGAALFAGRGCAGCHAGPLGTDDRLADVRGDGPHKTPTLVGLGLRLAYLHDGCAPTLLDRLTGPEACTGGDAHGALGDLDDADLLALAEWLRTL